MAGAWLARSNRTDRAGIRGTRRGPIAPAFEDSRIHPCWDGVGSEIANNRFTIRTDKPNVKVSWQVTARRSDPYMRAHPFQAEQAKTGLEQGRYVTPQAYGKPASDGIDTIKPPPQP
jgi:hypothetical protein